jgi:hypothetical protein
MSGADAQAQCWPNGAEDNKRIAIPLESTASPQTPPYWTLDTVTEEWVQRQRDGTEIRRAPTRHKHERA